MKRTFLLLSVLAFCLSIICVVASLKTSHAQTATDEVSLRLLPVPANVIGTTIRGVSNDGKRIVFDSINSYTGGNVDSNTEIYVYDVDTRSVIQITDTVDIMDPADSTKRLFAIDCVTPAISGDGTKIVFVSNADLGGATNDDHNYEIYLASLPRNSTQLSISRITNSDKNTDTEVVKEIFNNYAPGINDDGSVITFVSTRRKFGAIDNGPQAFTVQDEGPDPKQPNDPRTDGNGEVFVYNATTRGFTQVTRSRDVDATDGFTVKGFNSAPIPSGDGKSLVFVSGFNYPGADANKNPDLNGELFIYKMGTPENTFTQVTDTTGAAIVPTFVVSTASIIYTLNPNAPMNILNSAVHPLSRDGSLLTFESAGNFTNNNTDKTRELWLYNVNTKTYTQLTNQTLPAQTPAQLTQDQLRKIDYNFSPSINSTGTHVSFCSTANLTPASTSSVKTDNADGSRDVFRYDIAAQKLRQVTFGDKLDTALEQDTITQPYIDNTGTSVTFSFLATELAPNASAINDLFQAVLRPVTGSGAADVKVANSASFDTTQVARGSLVSAFGAQLSNGSMVTPSANLPFELGGVTINVNGLAAPLIFISPGQVNFLLPSSLANADMVDFTINNNGVLSTGKITKIVDAAPGVFTNTIDGTIKSAALCGRVSPDGLNFLTSLPPCSVGNSLRADVLSIYGTGWRNVSGLQVKIGDLTLTPSFSGAQPDFPGLDQINVDLTADLAGKTDLDVTVIVPATTAIESNKSKTSFLPTIDGAITMVNGASLEAGTVARSSFIIAQGMNLSNDTVTLPGPNYPTELNGVKVTIAGLPALITSIEPTKVGFIAPDNITPADLVEVAVNNNGVISRGRVKVQDAAPGITTTTGDGAGIAVVRCGVVNPDTSITFSDPPCSIGPDGNRNIIRVLGTGWRNAPSAVTLKIGDTQLITTYDGPLPGIPGVDILEARLDPALAGKTDLDAIITATVGDKTFSSKAGIKVSIGGN